jgi:capsular polysaccharide transport system permease protein
MNKDKFMDTENLIGLSKSARHERTAERPVFSGVRPIRHRLRGRLRGLSFLACVLLPTAIAGLYEYGIASDEYVSELKFIVRQQAPQTSEPTSMLADLGGGNPMLAIIEDSEVVVQYIGSLQILADLRGVISLDNIYATNRADWLSRLTQGLPPEKQLPYWQDVVRPYFDISSGVITVKILAFTPQDSEHVAQAVLSSSEALVDEMSQQARQNALVYAEQTAAAAQAKLVADEAHLADYRNEYSVLFPELSAESGNSVGEVLTQQLSEDEAELASLRSLGQGDSSPQVQTLRARIAATQAEIGQVEAKLAVADGGKTRSLATIISGYDSLDETEKLDEQLYASDLIALQNARNFAAEKSLYLESFVRPILPEASIQPERWLITAETALAGLIAWILLTLVTNIIRDQVD